MSSPDFSEGASIPARFTCTGDDVSPVLAISALPEGAKSIVIIVEDPDAPSGTFLHWLAYDIPTANSTIPGAIARGANLTGGGHQGMNDFGKVGYNGPCPPPGAPHRYRFQAYALDAMTNLAGRATVDGVRAAMNGHVTASGVLTAGFGR